MSAAKPMWKYFLRTRLSPSRLSVELGELLQRGDRGLDHEGEHRDLDARLLVLLVELHAERLELGDVGLVVVGDVRDHHPVAVQVRARDLLDAAERLALDRAELREVDLRPRQQVEAAAARRRRAALRLAAAAAALDEAPARRPA